MTVTSYPLQALFADVSAWVADNAEDTGHQAAGWHEGAEMLAAHDSPPRYVWVPLEVRERDRDEMPIPPDEASLNPDMGGIEQYGEPVDVDVWRVAVHCWGESRADAWALYRELRRALRALDLMSVVTFAGAQFLRAESGSVLDRGAVVVVSLDVHVPLTMAAETTVVPDAVGATTYLDRRREGLSLEEGC